MKDQDKNIDGQPETADKPQSAGRRSLLKGTATALPAILTLQSGAALARSSNLISTTQYKMPDRQGRTLCLDLDSVDSIRGSGVADLGPSPSPHIYAINERDYHLEANAGSATVDETTLCHRGGRAFFQDRGWQEINMPHRAPGGIVSATAIMSFAGSAVVTEL